jgi:hypothetical protein
MQKRSQETAYISALTKLFLAIQNGLNTEYQKESNSIWITNKTLEGSMILDIDALNLCVGVVLSQEQDGVEKVFPIPLDVLDQQMSFIVSLDFCLV